MNTAPRTLLIQGKKVTQRQMTFAQAHGLGYFAGDADWTGRAVRRPADSVFIYHIGAKLIGMVDGEGASFDSLADWVESITGKRTDIAAKGDELEVRIEAGHECTMHQNLIATLEQAAATGNLDAALKIVDGAISPDFWIAGRGGSHVWLSHRRYDGPVRVAMICEKGAE